LQLAYNGIVPGPTIETPKGRQTVVRFNNRIPADSTTFHSHLPCNTAQRQGRPIAIHLHGSASLAPYDGWAEDTICSGESKDYVSVGAGRHDALPGTALDQAIAHICMTRF
jgi:hypothetical protein